MESNNEKLNEDLKSLFTTFSEADEKFEKAKASKERAQKTLTKSKRDEKSAAQTAELAKVNMKLLCAENGLDYEQQLEILKDS
jgi:F0F1-type ATP synthase epsilon subunit